MKACFSFWVFLIRSEWLKIILIFKIVIIIWKDPKKLKQAPKRDTDKVE